DDGYAWEYTAERVSSRPQIESVSLVSEWESFGDLAENQVSSDAAGEQISIAYRYRAVVHNGTFNVFTQTEIHNLDTGDRIDIETDEYEQVTEGSGYQVWEGATFFDTTGWDPGEYRAEVTIRDEVTGNVSAPSETTFELR
ncbi:MAG: hypothetical protein ACOCY1_04895, partial [Halovenus sp.]